MILCVLIPRFALTTALGDRAELLHSLVALAPEPGGTQQIGEVSLAAEAFGVHSGMRLGEALARCPRLTLVPPDPAGVADLWERLLVRLESMGAAVEPERPGLVCFEAQGLLRLGAYLTRDGARYSQAGLRILDTLFDAAGPYLSTDPRHQGLLLHSVYHWPRGWDHVPAGARTPRGESSQWGDYHAREVALYVLRLARGGRYLTFHGGEARRARLQPDHSVGPGT